MFINIIINKRAAFYEVFTQTAFMICKNGAIYSHYFFFLVRKEFQYDSSVSIQINHCDIYRCDGDKLLKYAVNLCKKSKLTILLLLLLINFHAIFCV